ncbi:bifunctional folylpolyglutamate synthase/dihydrofolate synthase [Campylobacter pinnipediorum subsp. pinnipediorum]|uniref:Mur ligase family protein n=1 Tax=Campylobacter pinnipediorum TaxID=1965231 RepID=UPI00099548F9|nr:Mur ligase family protein [Campylobacter pinnipediorum]OPA74410.1 bifunctional folylpolyglutamate synthase/dihydrofolate synthase [Campylobacter pinnipediorum subsp. pinnipediorum]
MSLLKDFLSKKPLFYEDIDYDTMPKAWNSIKEKIRPFKIIHIVGTNGKGSTGRFLAQILKQNGNYVGHYTSPHIFNFNERFWLDGKVVSDNKLELAHQKLQDILNDELIKRVSYFEYATLLSAILFCECDYFICEAGMGGELDATNVFDKQLSIFTPIGLDHTAVLGDTLEQICETKFNAIQKKIPVLLNNKMDKTCVKIGFEIANAKQANINFAKDILNQTDMDSINLYSQKFSLPNFLRSNLTLACGGAKQLLGFLDISKLDKLNLRGRCEKIANNVYIDVGHNELGALQMIDFFQSKKINLIYNSFLDKDFDSILNTLKPILKHVFIYEYTSSNRELGGEKLKSTLDKLNIPNSIFDKENLENIFDDKNNIYLVFGSFLLVESFLEKLQTRAN